MDADRDAIPDDVADLKEALADSSAYRSSASPALSGALPAAPMPLAGTDGRNFYKVGERRSISSRGDRQFLRFRWPVLDFRKNNSLHSLRSLRRTQSLHSRICRL
jgi:hypothetical protein